MPHLADDAVRMLKVLPGVTGGDFSAALNIRGGRREEAMLTVDGAEIHNGFHFRDIDGALSVLDTNLVEGIDFITGGMTADYGDYMSGVVGLQSRRPSPDDEYRNGVGISFVSLVRPHLGHFRGRSRLVAGVRAARISRRAHRTRRGGQRAAHAALHRCLCRHRLRVRASAVRLPRDCC